MVKVICVLCFHGGSPNLPLPCLWEDYCLIASIVLSVTILFSRLFLQNPAGIACKSRMR